MVREVEGVWDRFLGGDGGKAGNVEGVGTEGGGFVQRLSACRDQPLIDRLKPQDHPIPGSLSSRRAKITKERQVLFVRPLFHSHRTLA